MSKAQAAFEDLFAIERGLRSTIKADQQKALDSIPGFLNTYHDEQEILQSTVLRLIDYFKSITSNDRRLALLAFLEKDPGFIHFAKLKNGGEEFGRRLVPLWEVNDTLAKVMMLRWFAILHSVLHDLPEILYRLHLSLASEHREELVQAIRVLKVFTGHTKRLPEILLDSILYQIEAQSMMSKLTLDLIQLLQSVELDPESAFVVWKFFESKDFTQVPDSTALKTTVTELLRQNENLFT